MLTESPTPLDSHSADARPLSIESQRFTRDGDQALEAWLHSLCVKSGAGIQKIVPPDRLEALILGGGYGRGEGGVLKTIEGDAPYNDLEFFVLIKGSPRMNERQFGQAIDKLGHRLTDESGLEVEFKITSLKGVQNSETTMFYYDLVSGHRVTVGPKDILAGCAHHSDAAQIPLYEATRLLMNRCSGLLYAQERLHRSGFTDADADFTSRNIAKAQLAMGDALLTAVGQFHWSCLERHGSLKELQARGLESEMPEIVRAHEKGVEFKLHPAQCAANQDSLLELHGKTKATAWHVWRWVEGKRLSSSFSSPDHYARDRFSKCPETNPIKNLILRSLVFGLRSGFSSDRWRYPRESLLRTLPVLLWENDAKSWNSSEFVSRWLHSPAPTWKDGVAAYERLWCRFN